MPNNSPPANQPDVSSEPETTVPPLPQPLENFLDQIIDEKGFPEQSLPANFKEQAKDDLRPLLQKAINLSLFSALPQEKRQEFTKLTEQDANDEQLQQFFTDNLANQEEVMAKTMLEFRTKYLNT